VALHILLPLGCICAVVVAAVDDDSWFLVNFHVSAQVAPAHKLAADGTLK
jgi:hypothetical protein